MRNRYYKKSKFQISKKNKQNERSDYIRYVINNYEMSKNRYYESWTEELKKEGNEKIKSVIDHKYQCLIADIQKDIDEWNKKLEDLKIINF